MRAIGEKERVMNDGGMIVRTIGEEVKGAEGGDGEEVLAEVGPVLEQDPEGNSR